MVFNSLSKINLSLTVNSKLKNNFHEIQTYYCLIDLADKIKINKINAKKDRITFKGPFAKFVNKSNNSIINLLRKLRSLNLISNKYSITIIKNIPVYAGLGGGTGNAAFILRYLIKDEINKKLINQLEGIVGSDLKLFFYKQGFMKNLETIINIKIKKNFFFVLIQPKIYCSTKEIYSKVRKYSAKKIFEKKMINNEIRFTNYLSNSRNDLQSIVEKKYPLIRELLTEIKNEKGCCFSRMTGSGSVCYGLFKDKITAKKALNNLKTKYPKFWLSFAKTV